MTDEQLACLKQTSFQSTTSLIDPFLATMARNRFIAVSLLTYTAEPLAILFPPSFTLQLNITFIFLVFIF